MEDSGLHKVSRNRKKKKVILLCLLGILLICFFLSFRIGRYPVPLEELIKILCSSIVPMEQTWPNEMETVVFNIRLPRIIAAILVGAALSVAGAAYQGMFNNPMVSPDVLGASAGAGFGAALAILLGLNHFGITSLSFFFGMIAVATAYLISQKLRDDHILGMVLAGIMIGSLFSSAISLVKLVADPTNILPAITYWLMGSLAAIKMTDVWFAFPLIAVGIGILLLVRWKINMLTFGEEEAEALGVNTKGLKLVVVCCATMITAASVAISGMIGWVGLVIPHFARMLVGHDYRILLPASMIMGSSYLLLVDNLARVMANSEVPLGILTSFVGAPFFILLIANRGKKW